MKWLKLTLFIILNISLAPMDYNNMSPVVSTEDGKTAQIVKVLLNLGNL